MGPATFSDHGFKVQIRPYLDGQAGVERGGRLSTSFPHLIRLKRALDYISN